MNICRSNSNRGPLAGRRLTVQWLESAPAFAVRCRPGRISTGRSPYIVPEPGARGEWESGRNRVAGGGGGAFTILEMLIVVGIIGLLAALTLPNIKGMTQANSMTVATRQLIDDLTFARQRAVLSRSPVCFVFGPGPNFWTAFGNGNNLTAPKQLTNLFTHQYSCYAVVALRTVGDQPGRPSVHYLTDWKYLPQGVFVSPLQITNMPYVAGNYVTVTTTNTSQNTTNGFQVYPFPTNLAFPFPSTYTNAVTANLPYIPFSPNGQLATNADQYILLCRGAIISQFDGNGNAQFATPVDLEETPPGNDVNNPNLVHVDYATGRAVLEHNQF